MHHMPYLHPKRSRDLRGQSWVRCLPVGSAADGVVAGGRRERLSQLILPAGAPEACYPARVA